jgi:hypothetical protein
LPHVEESTILEHFISIVFLVSPSRISVLILRATIYALSSLIVVWTSLGPLLRWVLGSSTRWAPRSLGIVDLYYTAPTGVEHKDYRGLILG